MRPLAGHDDADQVRVDRQRLREQLDAVHAGHHQVGTAARRTRRARARPAPSAASDSPRRSKPCRRATRTGRASVRPRRRRPAGGRVRRRGHGQPHSLAFGQPLATFVGRVRTGSTMRTVVPVPDLALDLDRPAGVPARSAGRSPAQARPLALVLGGEERLASPGRACSGGMPTPVSATSTTTQPSSSGCKRTVSVPPRRMASPALVNRFRNTCRSCCRSAWTGARSGRTRGAARCRLRNWWWTSSTCVDLVGDVHRGHLPGRGG